MTDENKHMSQEISHNQFILLRLGLNDRRDIRRLGEAVYEAEALAVEEKLPAELEKILRDSRQYYDELRRQFGQETTQMRYGDLRSRYNAVQSIRNCVAMGQKYIYDATTDTDKPAYQILQEAQALFMQACEDSAEFELNLADKNKNLYPRYVVQRLEKTLQEPFGEIWLRKLHEKQDEIKSIVSAQERAEEIQSNALREGDYLRRFEGMLHAYSIFQNIPGISEQLEQTRYVAISMLATQIIDALHYANVVINTLEFETARNKIRDAEFRLSSWPERDKPVEINNLDVELQETKSQVLDREQSWREYTQYAAIIREQIVDSDRRAVATQLFDRIIQDDRFKNYHDLHILKLEVERYNSLGELLATAKSAYVQLDWSKAIEVTEKVLVSGMAGLLASEFHKLQLDAQLELNIQTLYNKIFAENYKEARYLLNNILSTQDKNKRSDLENRLSAEIQFLRNKTGF